MKKDNNFYKLSLLGKAPILVGDLKVHPLTFREIAELTEQVYNQYVSILTFNISDLQQDIDIEGVTAFDILVANCHGDIEFRKKAELALSTFLKEQVLFNEEYLVFYVGDPSLMDEIQNPNFVHRENFDDIAHIIRLQNLIEVKVEEPKPTNVKRSKKYMELEKKRNKGRKIIAKAKGGEGISLSELLSCLGVFYQDLNKAYDLTVYQLYDQYDRFMKKESYQSDFQMYIAGADPKQLKLEKHWTAK